MATNVTSLGVKNTLVVGGLATLASVVITTATITTLGVTTANITTANVQTLSGSTIRANVTFTGANLVLSGKNGAVTATVRKIPCYKTGGQLGTLTVTATGAIGTGACS